MHIQSMSLAIPSLRKYGADEQVKALFNINSPAIPLETTLPVPNDQKLGIDNKQATISLSVHTFPI